MLDTVTRHREFFFQRIRTMAMPRVEKGVFAANGVRACPLASRSDRNVQAIRNHAMATPLRQESCRLLASLAIIYTSRPLPRLGHKQTLLPLHMGRHTPTFERILASGASPNRPHTTKDIFFKQD